MYLPTTNFTSSNILSSFFLYIQVPGKIISFKISPPFFLSKKISRESMQSHILIVILVCVYNFGLNLSWFIVYVLVSMWVHILIIWFIQVVWEFMLPPFNAFIIKVIRNATKTPTNQPHFPFISYPEKFIGRYYHISAWSLVSAYVYGIDAKIVL